MKTMYCDVILFDIENVTKLCSLARGSNMNSKNHKLKLPWLELV